MKKNARLKEAALLDAIGVVPITYERFNAYIAWIRSPKANAEGIELEFFSDKAEKLIGLLRQDRCDRDFGFAIFARDIKSRFHCIDVECGMTRTRARQALFASFIAHRKTFSYQRDGNPPIFGMSQK